MHRIQAPMLLLAMLTVVAAGCQRDDDGSVVAPDPVPPPSAAGPLPATPAAAPGADDVRSGVPNPIAMPAPDTVTPPLAEGAEITYTCEDGSDLRITYAADRANLTFADGRVEPMARAPASDPAISGELYLGAVHGLHRIGTVVELRQQDGAIRRCRETGGSA